jgi:uncharacterized linocin/CFP29 family protein
MHSDLVDIGWTDEQWNRISSTVAEEAQKVRVAAQMLPLVGPEDPTTIAVPHYRVRSQPSPESLLGARFPDERLSVNSDPTLYLTTISVNVPLHAREVADLSLNAALVMFRRAANYIARIEDGLVFGGRGGENFAPPFVGAIPPVFKVTGAGSVDGLVQAYSGRGSLRKPTVISQQRPQPAPGATADLGNQVVNAIVDSISQLDGAGHMGPYACALAPDLFAAVCEPTASLVMPRDRILPILQGPLLRASLLLNSYGVVVALSGNPVELVVASDISVRYLQTTLEPRYVFRVSERVALRIKEESAIGVLMP